MTEFMEEVLIDDNMVFDIDNLKGFLNDTSSFGFIAKENNKIIGFAYCYTLLRGSVRKTRFYNVKKIKKLIEPNKINILYRSAPENAE